MADKYTLMQGPNGEALVYSTDTGTVMPLPGTDPAAGGPGAPMRFQEAQAKWYDLLPQIPALLQSAADTKMQPGVVPQGYNPPPPPAAMPPSGPPRQSPDGRYTEVDTPDGRMIQDTQSGVRYSANMAPQDVLSSLYGPAAPLSQRPSDAATPVGQTAPPIVNGVVKENVYGNPTAGERANGTVTTQYPLPATPGAGSPAPGGAPGAAVGAGAAPRPGFTLPRMTMPANVDYSSPGSIFASYTGVNRPGAQVAPAPQSQGTQFAPLSVAPLAAAAAPGPANIPPPQISVKPAPAQVAAPSAASAPTVNINGQQVATLQPSAIVGSAAYNQQQAANKAAFDASNVRGAAAAAQRVWGYIPDTSGENGAGGYGWVAPDQLTTPPATAAPNPRPDLTGMTAGAATGTQGAGGGFRLLSAVSGTPVGGGGGLAPTDTREDNPWSNPDARTPPPVKPPVVPPATLPDTGTGVPPGLVVVPTVTQTQARDPYTGAPLFNTDGTPMMTTSQSQTYGAQPGYMTPEQTNQLVASTGLTRAQTDQIMNMIPIQMRLGQANIDQIYAAIDNAAKTLGLQIDQQRFNQAYQTTAQQIQQGQYQQTTSGFDANGNPTLAALSQQAQNALGYAASNRADIGVQQANTAMMGRDSSGNPTLQAQQAYGYDQNGNPTLQGQQTISSEDRANLLAQAQIGDQAATIQLQDLQRKEGARQFDANNALARQEADRQWRQNPASFLDQAWSQRGQAAPTSQGTGFAAPASAGTQYSTMSAPVGSVAATQGQAGYTPATQQGPLSYADIQRSGVEPPGVRAATGGFQQMPQYQTAGGVPRISQQAYGQLNPTEQQAFGAELQATGNNPADYFKQQQMLTQPAVRSSGGFSAPRPQVAGSL